MFLARSFIRRYSVTHKVPGFGSFTGPVGPSTQSQYWIKSTPFIPNSHFDVIVIGGGHAGTYTHYDHL